LEPEKYYSHFPGDETVALPLKAKQAAESTESEKSGANVLTPSPELLLSSLPWTVTTSGPQFP
jgi:hypothetical protein